MTAAYFLMPLVAAPLLFRVIWYGIFALVYVFFLYSCLRCIVEGGEWRWEITEESVILDSPYPSAGARGVIPLEEICAVIREGTPGDGKGSMGSIRYYLIDSHGGKWWLTENPGFDIFEFVRELRKRKPVPFIE